MEAPSLAVGNPAALYDEECARLANYDDDPNPGGELCRQAQTLQEPVMSGLIIDAIVDAAAEAAYTKAAWDAQNFTGTNWTELDPAHRTPWLREAEAALEVVAPLIAAQALLDSAKAMRSCKDRGHWNLRDPHDPETSYSPDVWLERRSERLEQDAGEL